MKSLKRGATGNLSRRPAKTLMLSALSLAVSAASSGTLAQSPEPVLEEVIVTSGIRASLASALNQKRNADNLKEVIMAEDIGKLPDQNLAEVLENITGVQITRRAGIGNGVQIRGTNANRIEINGASTTGSGAGRSGIDFEDVNASIIAGVEVIKAPEAKTIEGSVGGTINLKTIRPLDLQETLFSARLQGEDSSLSSESTLPRFSAAFGDNWETSAGDFGFVISGSYTEQEAVSFRPRTDRDNLSSVPGGPQDFLGIQFLLQEQENDDYETINVATSFEFAPNDNLKFYFDAIINEQERSADNYRLQASGVSTHRNRQAPDVLASYNIGQVGDANIGTLMAAEAGTIEPDLANDDDDPNLRFSSETGSRVTDSEIFRLGGEWNNDAWTVSAEFASTSSDTVNPKIDTTLNFINPNCPLDGAATGDPSTSNDNCVPFVYDLRGGSLAFGINFDSPFAPTVDQLLDPANVVLDDLRVERDTQENSEDSFRTDFSFQLEEYGITSVDFGYRYNNSDSKFENIDDRVGGFSRLEDSPSGDLFAELLVRGPSNYGEQDGRTLAIRNFLLIDPDRSFSDPAGTIAILERALAEKRAQEPQADGALTIELESDQNAFYDIEEETHALYAQVNFETGIFRGNFGVRYVQTDLDSTAFDNGVLTTTSADYSFLLPRFNLVAQPAEDLLIRLGVGKDIRRPDFDDLNTGFTFDQSENETVERGNAALVPEEVISFDIGAEWYFAPSSVVSIGYFNKERKNLFTTILDGALLSPNPDQPGAFLAETDPTCPGGGIFNPAVIPNVLGDDTTTGLCVDFETGGNDPATTTQQGIELAVQYDLAQFEDRLGWASGFGFIFNYTTQDFSGGAATYDTSGRGETVLGNVSQDRGLLDFSEDAYNFTVYYEKYGLSARMRYTWRDEFRTEDFAGGASLNSTFSFPVVTDERAQLNASVSYDITENFTIGVEAVNLTEENIEQRCINANGPLCYVGYPDRRITFGLSYRM